MKKLPFSWLLLLVTLISNAQSVKIDMEGHHLLHQYKRLQDNKIVMSSSDAKILALDERIENDNVCVFVEIKDEAAIGDIEAVGGIVLSRQGDILIAQLPLSEVEKLAENNDVCRIQFDKKISLKLDKARAVTNTEWAHGGLGLDHKYTGEGVILGMMDTGLDAGHVTFMNSDQTKSRISRLLHFNSNDGTYIEYTPENLSTYTYDTNWETHGTHVASIMGGAYNSATLPYRGVAPNAELMLACGDLYVSNISVALDKIVEYANSKGKTPVINLSVGTSSGPHDGTDLYGQWLSRVGEKSILCLSAGNEGEYPIVLSKKFTPTDKEMKSLILGYQYEGYPEYYGTGTIDIWSDTDKQFSVTVMICNASTGEVVTELVTLEKPTVSADGQYIEWKEVVNSNLYNPENEGEIKNTYFDRAFSENSYIMGAAHHDHYNNRYCIDLRFGLTYNTLYNSEKKHVMAIRINGEENQRIDAYGDNYETYFATNNIVGFDEASADGTISNMACSENIIAVGSFNSRTYKTEIENNISSFSSYGTLIDGRSLPHVCAPGCMIYGAYSNPYVKELITNGDGTGEIYTEDSFSLKVNIGGQTHYWGGMSGTSMASPFVAGAIALWLEANPSLKYEDVLKIIQETSKKDSYVTAGNAVQWGAGKLDVLAGLKKSIELSAGIDQVITYEKRLIVTTTSPNEYEVFVAGEHNLNAVVYSMSGQPVLTASAHEDSIDIDVSGLNSGIYILTIQGNETKYTKRIVVK